MAGTMGAASSTGCRPGDRGCCRHGPRPRGPPPDQRWAPARFGRPWVRVVRVPPRRGWAARGRRRVSRLAGRERRAARRGHAGPRRGAFRGSARTPGGAGARCPGGHGPRGPAAWAGHVHRAPARRAPAERGHRDRARPGRSDLPPGRLARPGTRATCRGAGARDRHRPGGLCGGNHRLRRRVPKPAAWGAPPPRHARRARAPAPAGRGDQRQHGGRARAARAR